MDDIDSLERIIPDRMDKEDSFEKRSLELHLERYAFAIQHSKTGQLLDIACGSGYGSSEIINNEKFYYSHITAVDYSKHTLDYALKRYAHPNITFICSDAMIYNPAISYDTIISLETIEHLADPGIFARKLELLLKDDGRLIISAPITPSTDGNTHHLTNFSSRSFKKMFTDLGFGILAEMIQKQPYTFSEIQHSGNKRLSNTRKNLIDYYMKHPAVFLLRLRSFFQDGFTNKYMTLCLEKKSLLSQQTVN